MTNKDLIKQYANTGALLTEYQVNKLQNNVLSTYLRRRIMQAVEDDNYHLEVYEYEKISSPEVKKDYLDIKLGSRTTSYSESEIKDFTNEQLIRYVGRGGRYPQNEEQKRRVLEMDEEDKQEFLKSKTYKSRLAYWELELISPESFWGIGLTRVCAYELAELPSHLKKPYVKARVWNEDFFTERELWTVVDGESLEYYISLMITYEINRIPNILIAKMTPNQRVVYYAELNK